MAGQWHGDDRYFGLHYDLHAGPQDTELGLKCPPAYLEGIFKTLGVDFVQTDCKGHAGMTSWFSQTPGASVSPGVKKDMMAQWTAAAKKLKLPLHCHYSGIWDAAFGAKHPEWCVKRPDGENAGAPFGQNAGTKSAEVLCPRSPYVETLVIPQFLELIDRYGVKGFWVDGDVWAVQPCYCAACLKAWTEETGLEKAPEEFSDPEWSRWMRFTRAGFEAYVRKYCDAVHNHKKGVLVCSNWLQTFANPGEPSVPTDWISGDNSWVWGLDASRCEARFLATRGKPWDIMLWNFYCLHGMGEGDSPWVVKPPEMLQQEAAVLMASGGHVQVYENPHIRDGSFIDWRIKRMAQTGKFIKARQKVCQNSVTIPQVAVLHSETHLYSHYSGKNLMWSSESTPVKGAVFALLENHYSVDILDEWAMMRATDDYPVIVVPEQFDLSEKMIAWLKDYVKNGGNLLLTGTQLAERFGEDFTGITLAEPMAKGSYTVAIADGRVPIWGADWGFYKTTKAKGFGVLGKSMLLDQRLTDFPAQTVNTVGRGKVSVIPVGIFRQFNHNRYGMVRAFVGEAVKRLAGTLPIAVTAPSCVDITLRRKGKAIYIHAVNRASGLPNTPSAGEIDEIPAVGPVIVTLKLPAGKYVARRCFEKGTLTQKMKKSAKGVTVTVMIDTIRIHEAIEVK
ncbi:MAG: alpha-L-fucosidase [Kiritimatiellaeota bacterium]|nr:alpha-L-fucosidase [Kiritimatiellota bacterium]